MPSYKEVYEPAAISAAETHDIDVAVFLALIHQESKWDPNAISGDGAVGIAQIIPRWHPECKNPWKADIALNCAAYILRNHLNTFNGRYDMALAAYHQGGPTAQGYGGIVPNTEMSLYVKPILDHAIIIRTELRARQTKAAETVIPIATEMVTPSPTPPSPLMLPSPTPTPPPVDVALFLLPLIWATFSK